MSSEQRARLQLFLPDNNQQFVYWIPISILAGVGEEIAYRGVLFELVRRESGNVLLAIVICIAAFGAAHLAQGWRGALGVALLGFVFHLMVLFSGTLYAAMLFHGAYDLLLAIVILRLSRAGEQLPMTGRLASEESA
jgi:membrane protease YdiL (CAAX protease family)